MRLTVRHTTAYDYDVPMRFVAQSHRLTPGNSEGQKVVSWNVSAEGAVFGASFTDGGGDSSGIRVAEDTPLIKAAKRALKEEWGRTPVLVGGKRF